MFEENKDGETFQSIERSVMKSSAGQSRKRSAFELLVDQQEQERSTSTSKTVGSVSEILAASHQSASAVPSTSYLNSSMTNNALFQHASAAREDGGLYHHYHHQEEEPSSTRRRTYPAREEQEIARRPSSSHHSSSNSAISLVMPQHRFDFSGSATVPASSISSSTPATSQQELVPSHLFPSLQQSSSGDRTSSQFAAGMNLPYGIPSSNMIDPSASSSSALLTAGVHNSVPVAQVQKQGNASKKEGMEKKDKLSKDDTTSKKRKKPGRKKKKEGAPKRPMSAYNFFFQEERRRLLDALPKQDDGLREKKRRDRSPHNKISFSALGKTIGKNWKQLGSIELARYEELAKRDTDRYLQEMKVFEAKEQLEAAGDFQTPMKLSESISSTSKNEWFATNRSIEQQLRPITSGEQYDFESNSIQHGNASEMNIPPFNMSQYSHFLYQQNSETSSLLGSAGYPNHATNYQASQQAPYINQFMPQQQLSSQPIISSIQECQNLALISSATLKDEDIIELIPLEMDTLNSQTNKQEDSPTLYYFEKESGSPNS